MADPRFAVSSFTVALSGTVSDAIDIRAAAHCGLWVPVLNGTNSLGLLVGDEVTDVASANFVELRSTDGSLYSVNVGTGSCGISFSPDTLQGFASFKIKLSAPQAAARTFKLIQRL